MQLNITEALASPSIESMIQLVNYLIGRVNEKQSIRIFENEVDCFIMKMEKKVKKNNYPQVIEPNAALAHLVADYLSNLMKTDDISIQALDLGELLGQLNDFGESPNELIKKNTISKLIKILVQWRIQPAFTDRYDRTLKIYLVPYENKKLNACYYTGIYSIALFKSKVGYNEFIFFHEVGLMIAHWITGDHEKVPASFIEFSKKLRPGIEVNYVENFADLFAVAVMLGTSMAHKNPAYDSLTGDDLRQIKQYFTQLISSEVTIGHLVLAQYSLRQ